MHDWSPANLLAWMEQAFVLASLGSLLLALFRVRDPGTKLVYCHALLVICLVLPWIEPWRAAVPPSSAKLWIALPQARLILWLLICGGAAKLGWLLAGLWRIRRCRISSMPMYPIPESVKAASAVTQADAVFCVSTQVPGPVMLGWLNPVVLMPESFLALAEDAQCGVACHELLHVRRHDWLVTVLEELAGAMLWFNPAIWPLLAQARLAREQLVDAEVVRLTASREPYIDALLAIARGGSGLDLAPAPLFLRKRHLTQRVHLLLKDPEASPLRLVSSYASITALLALAGWMAFTAFPLVGRAAVQVEVAKVAAAVKTAPAIEAQTTAASTAPAIAHEPDSQASDIRASETQASGTEDSQTAYPSAPIPPDPHELATSGVRPLTSPAEIAAARQLMSRAQHSARMRASNAPPYRYDISFVAAGNVAHTGPGVLTEIRIPGTRQWTAELAGYSMTRWINNGWTQQDKNSSTAPMVPMRVQLLRDAMDWADANPPAAKLVRSASVEWNGKPTTCLLFSNWNGPPASAPARLWEESEYCIDDSSGLIQIESFAPGTYTVFGYGAESRFHGQAVPDRITIYAGGAMAADATLTIGDPSPSDKSLLTPDPNSTTTGPFVLLGQRQRVATKTPNPNASATVIQPVIVVAEIDGNGNAIEEELCAASDPALTQAALDLVKKSHFLHRSWNQYQLYINVKFMPGQTSQP